MQSPLKRGEHLEWLGRRPGAPTGRNLLGVNAGKALYAARNCKKCVSWFR